MKQTTIGVFEERADAEKAIDRVYSQLNVPADDISFLYRNDEGEVREVKTDTLIQEQQRSIGASISLGALAGAVAGSALGVITALGFTPFLQNLFATGPLANMLASVNIVGNLALIVGMAIIGAVLGVLAGAVSELIIARQRARAYSDTAEPKNVVVAVIAPEKTDVLSLLRNLGALDTRVYRLSI